MSTILVWMALVGSVSRPQSVCEVVETRGPSMRITLRAPGTFSNERRLFFGADVSCESLAGKIAAVLVLFDLSAQRDLKRLEAMRPWKSNDSVFQIVVKGTVSCRTTPIPAEGSEQWPESMPLENRSAQCRMIAERVEALYEIW